MAKHVLKAKRKTVSAMPDLVVRIDWQAVNTAMQIAIPEEKSQIWSEAFMEIVRILPAAPKSISFRLPTFSIVNTAIHDAMKYSVPLQAAMSLELNGVKPTTSSSTVGM